MHRLTLAAAIFFCATSVFATDLITLYIPVRVSHLAPSVTQARIQCDLTGTDPAGGTTILFTPTPKSQTFPLTGGAYSGTVTLVFTEADFTPALLATLANVNHGRCTLNLFAGSFWYVPMDGATGGVTGHAPGTPFSNPVSFAIH